MKNRLISWDCLVCKNPLSQNTSQNEIVCPNCQKHYLPESGNDTFETCRICGCKEFFRQKDFPRRWGCLIIGIAIVLVPWTYGISLPVFFLVDWWLYRRVSDMAVCYLCTAEYRGFALPEKIRAYKHVMAEGFERKRNETYYKSSKPAGRG